MFQFEIQANDAGQRLDKFLNKAVPTLPQSLLYKALRLKKIKVNRRRAEASYRLCEKDVVQLFLPDEFSQKDAKEEAFMHLTPHLEIVYEDQNILLCNKRPGMIVHSDDEEEVNTLIGHIHAYLYRKGEYDPKAEQSFAPSLCNRIDRNTGGIVIAAKNAATLRVLNQKIRDRELDKTYLCLVHGKVIPKSATLCAYLKKDSAKNQVAVIDEKPKNFDRPNCAWKEICTRYRVVEQKKDVALLEVELLTGRTHQIRAHLAHIGYPLLGDGKYGINAADRKKGYVHQALYSYQLRFDFKTDAEHLAYLNHKTFSLHRESVWFLKDFEKMPL